MAAVLVPREWGNLLGGVFRANPFDLEIPTDHRPHFQTKKKQKQKQKRNDEPTFDDVDAVVGLGLFDGVRTEGDRRGVGDGGRHHRPAADRRRVGAGRRRVGHVGRRHRRRRRSRRRRRRAVGGRRPFGRPGAGTGGGAGRRGRGGAAVDVLGGLLHLLELFDELFFKKMQKKWFNGS